VGTKQQILNAIEELPDDAGSFGQESRRVSPARSGTGRAEMRNSAPHAFRPFDKLRAAHSTSLRAVSRVEPLSIVDFRLAQERGEF
jgi:hypothetical protein